MLASLGMFVFETGTALFAELERRRDWRHARSDRFGARPASQYVGPGEDAITITGLLVPEIAGSYSAIEQIADMAATGQAWPLTDGTGHLFGQYTIERLDERKQNLLVDGMPRQVDFAIELKRVD